MGTIKKGAYIGKAADVVLTSTNVVDEVGTLSKVVDDVFQNGSNGKYIRLKKGTLVQSGDGIYSLEKDLKITDIGTTPEELEKVADLPNNALFYTAGLMRKVEAMRGKRVSYRVYEYENETTMDNLETWTKRYIGVNTDILSNEYVGVYEHNRVQYALMQDGNKIKFKIVDLDSNDEERFILHTFGDGFHTSEADSYARKGELLDINGKKIFYPKSCYLYDGWLYIRTHIDVPRQYHTSVDYIMEWGMHPLDLGFVYKCKVNALSAFDGSSATQCHIPPSQETAVFDFVTLEDVDRVTLVNFNAKQADIEVFFQDGVRYTRVINYHGKTISMKEQTFIEPKIKQMKNKLTGKVEVAMAYFEFIWSKRTSNIIKAGTKIRVTLKGTQLSIGEIYADKKHHIGYTNVGFSPNYTYMDPPKRDKWGIMQYGKEGRLRQLDVKVDFDSGQINKNREIIEYIGMNKIIFDGAYKEEDFLPTVNAKTDKYVTNAIKLVGYALDPKLSIVEDDGEMGDVGTCSMTIEESL